MSDFFSTALPPPWLEERRASLEAFVGRWAAQPSPLVAITSGGTTVPLERRTVRFIDNFSTGNRGAASAEAFLAAGYAVVFVHRASSAFPFARTHLPPAQPASHLLLSLDSGDLTRSSTAYEGHASRLLSITFTTVSEYLFLLREVARALSPAGPSAILFLSAAVSDFYVPEEQMVEHKIQSSSSTAEHVEGGIVIKLWPVPKLLAQLKRASEAWAPEAFVVSFKLETNRCGCTNAQGFLVARVACVCALAGPSHLRGCTRSRGYLVTPVLCLCTLAAAPSLAQINVLEYCWSHARHTWIVRVRRAILLTKAAASIAKYGVDVVCANLLQSYKSEVTLVTQSGPEPPSYNSTVQGDETDEAEVSGIDTEIIRRTQLEGDIEEALVGRLIEMHKTYESLSTNGDKLPNHKRLRKDE